MDANCPGCYRTGLTTPRSAYEQWGISLITAPINSLIGVFLSENPPLVEFTPERLKNDGSTPSINPILQQAFYIHHFEKSNTNTALISVPPRATRIVLGGLDTYGWYDNVDKYIVKIISCDSGDFNEDKNIDGLDISHLSNNLQAYNLSCFASEFGKTNLMPTLSLLPEHSLTINNEFYSEGAKHESVFARISNLQKNLIVPQDDADEFMKNYANSNGIGVEPSGNMLITHLLDNTWEDRLMFDNCFNTVYDVSPGPDKDGVFEIVSVSDEGGSIRGTNNTNSYYFSYDGLNDWNGSAITINQWINYLEKITNVYGKIGRLTIFTHGKSGFLRMSDSFILTTQKLQEDNNVRNELSKIKALMKDNAHILLFSCQIAKDNMFDNIGTEFIQELANLTGATVHANKDYTGNYNNAWFGSDTDWSLDVVVNPNN